MAAEPPTPQRLRALITTLEQGLLQRGAAVRLALLAALAGEHVLLLGPPGTAKSALARRLHTAFAGTRYFERLLTRFSTPEELFGPLSLKALEEDRYERLTDGFLPTAGVAFLDEVFKANSAILNALLTLLNERAFDNGSGRQRTPLISVVGASNEGPADESLQAFFDRFLLRVPVLPVDDEAFEALLLLPDAPDMQDAPDPAPAEPITPAERRAVLDAAAGVALSEEALACCRLLRAHLAAQGLPVSDRRWRQWMHLMRVAAATEGRAVVDRLDCWLAPYVAAATPAEGQALAAWFQTEVLQAVAMQAPWLTRAVEAFEAQLQIEQSARDEAETDGAAGKLALARAIGMGAPGEGSGEGGMLRIVSATLEAQLQRRYSPVHIAARVAQLDEVLAQAAAEHAAVAAKADALHSATAARLWLPPELAAHWGGAHGHTLAVLQSLIARLEATRAGFAALPEDAQAAPEAPPPVPLPEAGPLAGALA